ncbi:MAG: preprotein translocase subunit YajC [Chlamydiales bacterium]|nr:preprotein translocase subunit YajC [Chlamydiales bacterium]
MKKFFLLFPFAAFAQDSAASSQSSLMQTMLMIGLALVFFYVILWRPEQKRRKAAESMRGSMKKGDRVTAMGIVGTIDRIKEQTVVLKMVEGAKIEMLKAAITEVQPSSESEVPSSES